MSNGQPSNIVVVDDEQYICNIIIEALSSEAHNVVSFCEPAQALVDYERSLWHDRFQPQVASRIAALRATTSPSLSITNPRGGTRLVDREPGTLR